jgi:hypothetical protein
MENRFPPLAPQAGRRTGDAPRARADVWPLPVLPLGEWLVFGLFMALLALA